MYSKEQIIEEIRRIAEGKGVDHLSEEDFEIQSTIPISTVRFYMGSWARALQEAGLTTGAPGQPGGKTHKTEPPNEDELLRDLLRLYEDSGEVEVPSLAVIQKKGKYNDHHYLERWKSIAEAFARAREKFPKKPQKPKQVRIPAVDLNIDMKTKQKPVEKPEPQPVTGTASIPTVPTMPTVPPRAVTEKQPQPRSQAEPEARVPADMNKNTDTDLEVTMEPKIKFIPQTIKPKTIKKPRLLGESLNFRGLRFAPTNKEGVIYLFGMISHELGFIIESFMAGFPDAEGKRCLSLDDDGTTAQGGKWEQVKINFEYKSSDFKIHDHDADQCDIIVCWVHNWENCPIEILELKSIIQVLEG
jgi:hypothetical protein